MPRLLVRWIYRATGRSRPKDYIAFDGVIEFGHADFETNEEASEALLEIGAAELRDRGIELDKNHTIAIRDYRYV